jgi:hypothetical protein
VATPASCSIDPSPTDTTTQEGHTGSVSLLSWEGWSTAKPPTVDAGGRYSVPEGSTVTVADASAFDPDGRCVPIRPGEGWCDMSSSAHERDIE